MPWIEPGQILQFLTKNENRSGEPDHDQEQRQNQADPEMDLKIEPAKPDFSRSPEIFTHQTHCRENT
jgi:hypothetical protein